ncbi:MAG: hypothetical protein L0Z46_10760 [Nitrospiraceae bacterium]|nr:hypothetical protein [Nitrospiraceae bacterium]
MSGVIQLTAYFEFQRSVLAALIAWFRGPSTQQSLVITIHHLNHLGDFQDNSIR